MAESTGPILHVIVIGFHHKKGCQVEYSFPPLIPGAPNECPIGWKYLPTLALPDGSHNYDEDTVYFHLPSLNDPNKTIYGISCFKQIPVEKLVNRTSDLTRGTVQKSVCVLSTMPFYGHIQVKMALITHAYFDEGDFSKVSLLEETYHHLNACMNRDSQTPPQVFIGLSARDFMLQFKHKALLLFKLLLLEKRVLFYQSPVLPLCSAILTLLSLFPDMIETGLEQAACIRPSRPMSPLPNFENYNSLNDENSTESQKSPSTANLPDVAQTISVKQKSNSHFYSDYSTVETVEKKIDDPDFEIKLNDGIFKKEEKSMINNDTNVQMTNSDSPIDENELNNYVNRDPNDDALNEDRVISSIAQIANINPVSCGLPLNLFSKGYLCFPYLSLPYLDVLGDENVRGYVIGATNVLFKQKKNLVDVLVEVENARIETNDPELRRQLHLTTEDLRFADYVARHVSEPKKDTFFDGVGWEGGDEWIRNQFRVYLLCLLRTSLQQDCRQTDHFNSSFMNAWRTTHNYKMWRSLDNTEIMCVEPGHPFAGQLSVQDMKLRFSHTMQTTEGGRKLNQAMASTGRAVATTGKAVGGAISQAKGAFSNWWSTLTTVQPMAEGPEQPNDSDAQSSQQQPDILPPQQLSNVREITKLDEQPCIQMPDGNL